ncbi:zinc metalloprotease HtpX [bacterium]|nr:zinc metalloprotease HtpX [bacterium]
MLNIIKSGLLIALMSVFLVFVGYLIGGVDGAMFFFAISLIFNFFSYFFSDRIVLAAYRARPADPMEHAWLFDALTKLANAAELPVIPKLYVIPISEPNAFATGRNPKHAVVAVTQGLLNALPHDEVAAVIAHELGHVKHYDILIQTVVAAMASAIMWIATIVRWGGGFVFRGNDRNDSGILGWLFVAILAPITAILVQSAISRSREYLADDYSRKLMGSGEYLISALKRISGSEEQIVEAQQGSAISPSTAHMFIYSPKSNFILKMFSTHPSLEERINNLRK